MSASKRNWKRIIEAIIAILTVIGSFIGGQVAAQTGFIDIFNKNKIERV